MRVISLYALLGFGIRGANIAAFGDTGILVPKIRMLDKKSGGKPTQPAQGRCLSSNPMPLTIIEKKMLASFPPGKAKKQFVKNLKIKYGWV